MAKKKVKRYKKLIISHDCLVPKGAMQVESVFKEDTGEFKKKYETAVVKFDDSKQMMYNVMVKWNKLDADDWIMDSESVRTETLIDFNANASKTMKFTHKKDEDGDPFEINAHITEVFVVKENDPYFPDYIGSIARCAYFPDKDEYNAMKKLEFESSIEGDCELETIEIEVEKKKVTHKIKDLLKKIFNVEVEKDFDSVMENKKNTDLWNPISAFETAMFNAQYQYVYGKEKDVEKFYKEANKITKQLLRYLKEMTFETVEKGEEPKNKEGDAMEKHEVEAIVDERLQKALGLEEGQTMASVIKALGEKTPPVPMVKSKDADGKETEISLAEAIVGLSTELNTFKEDNEAKMKEISDFVTANAEAIKEKDPGKEPVEKSEAKRKSELAL